MWRDEHCVLAESLLHRHREHSVCHDGCSLTLTHTYVIITCWTSREHFSYSAFKQNINMHWMYSTRQCGWKRKWCDFHSDCILLTVTSHECLSFAEQNDKAFRLHVYELGGDGGRQDGWETAVPDGFSTFGSTQPLVIIIRRHRDPFFFFFFLGYKTVYFWGGIWTICRQKSIFL